MLKFEFSEQMVAVMGQLIGKAPYEVAAPILQEIQRQIDAQQKGTKPLNQKVA